MVSGQWMLAFDGRELPADVAARGGGALWPPLVGIDDAFGIRRCGGHQPDGVLELVARVPDLVLDRAGGAIDLALAL